MDYVLKRDKSSIKDTFNIGTKHFGLCRTENFILHLIPSDKIEAFILQRLNHSYFTKPSIVELYPFF